MVTHMLTSKFQFDRQTDPPPPSAENSDLDNNDNLVNEWGGCNII